MKSEGEDGIGLGTCSERGGMMTAWWRWSGNLKGRENWDDLKNGGKRIQAREVDQLGESQGRSARQG